VDDLPLRLDFEQGEERAFEVGKEDAGERLDRFLAPRLAEFSRSAVQRLIRASAVRLNGAPARASAKVKVGDRIEVDVPQVLPPSVEPQELPLRVLLEDAEFAVLDKEPGLAVHPGAGRPDGTLANAVAHRYGTLALGGEAHRPGIVHRLDLDTSGAIVVARTERAHAALADAFKERRVSKEYLALVFGDPPHDEDEIDLPLGRDLMHPTRMAVRFDGGRPSQTSLKVLERYGAAAQVCCRPRTGRTHQIRVHLLSRGHPLLGDRTYSRGRSAPVEVPRLMLHAWRLAFPHPTHGDIVRVEAPIPPDMRAVIDALREIDADNPAL
jgi:23S rRNA pseudouridine1911/1915/1917 synthase